MNQHDYIQLTLDGGEQLMHVVMGFVQPCAGRYCVVCWKPPTDTSVPWHTLEGTK